MYLVLKKSRLVFMETSVVLFRRSFLFRSTNRNWSGQRGISPENNTDNWHFKGDRPAVIDFYATWCGPCKAMAPHLERIAEEYDGKIDVYKVDVDQESELSAVFNIRSVPTLLFIPMNDTPQMATGALSYGQLKEVVDTHLLK